MLFPVSPKKQQALDQAFAKFHIQESDLEESFVRSGGPGGQNVNKVSTCVVLKHRISGMVVKCQQERSQAMNRYYARLMLVQKLDQQLHQAQSQEARRIVKLRKQKRKRSKRAKEKLLETKRFHSEKKQARQKMRSQHFES